MFPTLALSGPCRGARPSLLGHPKPDQKSGTRRRGRLLCRAEGEEIRKRASQRAEDVISRLEALGIRDEATQPSQPQTEAQTPARTQIPPAVQKREKKASVVQHAVEEDPNDERTWNWDRFFAGVLFGAGLQGTILCIWVLKHTQLVSDWIALHGF